MGEFDSFAVEYSYWIERVNPSNYPALLEDYLPPNTQRALDAGCGPGKLAIYLSEIARHVVAVDISGSMLQMTRRSQAAARKTNIHLVQGDLNQVYFKPGSFDFIGSDCVLHDTDQEIAVSGLRALLRPGGWLVIRDVIFSDYARSKSPLWQVLRTCRQIPMYFKKFSLQETLRLLSFELSPSWVRHKCEGANLTAADFRSLYSRLLPGCRLVDHGWTMTAYWQAPG